MDGWREWRDEAAQRAKAGRRLLDGGEYRPHVERAAGTRSGIDREVGALEAAVALDGECAALLEDWRAHGDTAEAAGVHPFHGEGYEALAARLEEVSGRQGLPVATAAHFTGMLEEHEALVRAGRAVRNVLPSYRKMDERRAGLLAEAEASGAPIADLAGWKEAREEAGALMRAGKAVLESRRFGVHLDRDPADRALVERVAAAAEADALLADALDSWRKHAGEAEAAGLSPFDAEGAEEAMALLRALAARDDLPAALPQSLRDLMDEHAREMRARNIVEGWRGEADWIANRRSVMIDEAARKGLAVAELPDWKAWRANARTVLDRGTGLPDDPRAAIRFARLPGLRASVGERIGALRSGIDADDAATGLLRDWNAHVDAALAGGVQPSRAEGYGGLVARLDAMARRPGLDKPTAARLSGLAGQNGHEERERVRKAVAAEYRKLFERAGGKPSEMPFQAGYKEFRESLAEARGFFDPDSKRGEQLAAIASQLDGQDKLIQRLKALTEQAGELSEEMLRLRGGVYWRPPDTPVHERDGFPAWRRKADRFLAEWEAVERDAAMVPHLYRSSLTREVLEGAAELCRRAEYQAPEPAKRQQRRTQTLDRSEGGGVKL